MALVLQKNAYYLHNIISFIILCDEKECKTNWVLYFNIVNTGGFLEYLREKTFRCYLALNPFLPNFLPIHLYLHFFRALFTSPFVSL